MSITQQGSKYRSVQSVEDRDRVQLETKELAKGSWRQGQYSNAMILLDSVLAQEMSPHVAAECWITYATFRSDNAYFDAALSALKVAAPFLDDVSDYVRGTFFNERARAHKGLGEYDDAATDYAGALASFEIAGNVPYQAAVCNNVAGLHLIQKQYDDAHVQIKRAIDLCVKSGSDYLSQALDTQASIYLAENRFTDALASIDQAISKVGEHQTWLSSFLVTRGKIKARIDNLTAKNDFDRAIQEAKEAEWNSGIATACCALIQNLTLPIEDLINYYHEAESHDSKDLAACARVIMDGLPRGSIEDMEVDMVRRALIKTQGSITRAAELVGLTHKGVDYVINRHPEKLLHLRTPRRRSTIIEK